MGKTPNLIKNPNNISMLTSSLEKIIKEQNGMYELIKMNLINKKPDPML
jgi:hypothetical protein